MKRIYFCLIALLMTGFLFTASAALDDGSYHLLKVVRAGDTSGNIHEKKYLSVDPTRPDSLVLVDSLTMLKQLDYSLWMLTTKVSAVGQNAYEIVNKRGMTLAFDAPTAPLQGDSTWANEAPAILSDGAWDLWNDVTAPDGFSLESYVTGPKYRLAVNDSLKMGAVTLVAAVGTKESKYLFFTAEKPAPHRMTADELNDKLGDHFKLFFYYQQQEQTSGFVPDSTNGMTFVADTSGAFANDTLFYIRVQDTAKYGQKYLYVDTVSYITDTTNFTAFWNGTRPTDGSRMLLKLDTVPSVLAAYYYTRLFAFYTDPGSTKDSVAVFVYGSYKLDSLATDSLLRWQSFVADTFPIQIDAYNSMRYLVTGADSLAADPRTHIAFKEYTYPTNLKKQKIYSIKVLNNDPAYSEQKGKYVIATVKAKAGYSNTVYDELPYTQFVYDGVQLVNRDTKKLSMGVLYKISKTEEIYSNFRDTFEIAEMPEVDKLDSLLGYAYFVPEMLQTENYLIDIRTGGYAGKTIGMWTDSVIGVSDNSSAFFALVADSALRHYGADAQTSIAGLQRQAYYFKDPDKAEYVYVQSPSKIVMSATNKTPFYLRQTPTEGEYVFVYRLDTLKLQVNSQSGTLEAVDGALIDNLFRLRAESDIATYKTDAKGWYELISYLGYKLTKNASDYAVYRNEGESVLKSSVYTADDLKLWIDTAQGTGRNPEKPSYYIVRNAKRGDGEELSGYFLHVLDSGMVADPSPYQVTIGGLKYNRLNFVNAKRFSGDSLLLHYDTLNHVKADSIGYKGKNEKAIKEYRFFLRETDVTDEYLLVAEQGYDGQGKSNGYLSILNDVLFVSPKSSAYAVKLQVTTSPTSNEVVKTSDVLVVSEYGAVTILNAGGKHVTVTNILGQQIANMIASSDRTRIEAPRGVVIVAIEGEAALKAVVK